MAKNNFERKNPQVGTIGHVDPDKTALTAAITTIMAKKNGGEAKVYPPIDVTPEEREYRSSSINNGPSTATSTYSFFNSTTNDSGKEAICSEEFAFNKV